MSPQLRTRPVFAALLAIGIVGTSAGVAPALRLAASVRGTSPVTLPSTFANPARPRTTLADDRVSPAVSPARPTMEALSPPTISIAETPAEVRTAKADTPPAAPADAPTNSEWVLTDRGSQGGGGGGQDGGPPLPNTGALFGAYVANAYQSGLTSEASFQKFEDLAGRGLALDRVYYGWDKAFPDEFDYAARAQGRTLVLSWGAAKGDGSWVKWKDIASGMYDSVIDNRAANIKAFAAPMFFTFNHEPENDGIAGKAADFVAAWKHIHDRFVALS